jgi:hypothetical protein
VLLSTTPEVSVVICNRPNELPVTVVLNTCEV